MNLFIGYWIFGLIKTKHFEDMVGICFSLYTYDTLTVAFATQNH